MKRSELRKDYIQDKYVIIAPRRGKRPHDFKKNGSDVHPHDNACGPFCPENIDSRTTELQIGKGKNWKIAVIPNKFPAVTLDNPKAYGKQEVVIETPEPQKHLDELPVKHLEQLLEVYAQRTKEISEDKKIQYVLIFKNEGEVAGASIHHAHSQIFATSFLPPNLLDKSQKVQNYRLKNGTCVYCDVIKKEKKQEVRMVWENKHVAVFCPYASRHNYEVWILPKRHLDNVTLLNDKERHEFARAMKLVLPKIRELNLPYNYYFHQVIFDEDQHLYMKIVPRGSVWAGVEIGAGVVINAVAPEDAAKFYRAR